MRKTILIVFTCFICIHLSAQIIYEKIRSVHLNTERQLKIKLPKNYDPSSDLKHPLIIVFDGDYMFEPVAGQVDFQTYFDDMPASIVVGVIQGNERGYDGYCDEYSGLPVESGFRFYNFIVNELVPYIENSYGESKFKVAVGHDLMGNFINSFLYNDKPFFQAYVCISPDLTGDIKSNLGNQLNFVNEPIFYYMSTSTKDVSHIREAVLNVNSKIATVENQNLTYYFDEFQIYNHFTMVSTAISKSFDKIFELYQPLREKELEEKVLPYEGTLDEYLIGRYDRIEDYFGIHKPISDQEFEDLVKIAEKRDDLKSLEKIGKLVKKMKPESLLGTYYLAQHAEKMGKTKKAKKLYESALELNDVSHINREYIFSKIDELTIVDTDEDEEQGEDNEEN
jgi:predicted alpha/beta superfamily hydrolase